MSIQKQEELTPEVIKRYLVHGDSEKVTEQEIMMFLNLCKFQNLNPFLNEAYLIKYGNEPASIIVSKDVFTKRASSCPDCEGWEAGVIVETPDGTVKNVRGSFVAPGEKLLGGWAKVYRKGWQFPLIHSVSLAEYQKFTKEGKLTRQWATMAATHIRKVALVQALREAFPEPLQKLYISEEMDVGDFEEPKELPKIVEEVDLVPPQEIVQSEVKPETKTENKPEVKMITEPQRKKIFAMARQLNLTENDIEDMIRSFFGKEHISDLTIAEASKLISDLARIPVPGVKNESN